jgi:hypothetical protein
MMDKRTGRTGDILVDDAAARESIAFELSREAMRHTQRALVGVFSIPASAALGLAAGVTWVSAFLERGFEVFERTFDSLAAQREGREPLDRTGVTPRLDEPAEKSKQARS